MEIIITNIIWSLVFIALFIYQIKDNTKRERKYQEIIQKLSKELENKNIDSKEETNIPNNICDLH